MLPRAGLYQHPGKSLQLSHSLAESQSRLVTKCSGEQLPECSHFFACTNVLLQDVMKGTLQNVELGTGNSVCLISSPVRRRQTPAMIMTKRRAILTHFDNPSEFFQTTRAARAAHVIRPNDDASPHVSTFPRPFHTKEKDTHDDPQFCSTWPTTTKPNPLANSPRPANRMPDTE
jgi:hypothetical protein